MQRSLVPGLIFAWLGPWLAISTYLAAESSPSAQPNAHVWQPRTKSVSVFKNGLGFFTLEGEAQLADGWCYAADVPPAAFGTLAIYAADTDQVVDIISMGEGELIEFNAGELGDNQVDGTQAIRRQRLERAVGMVVSARYIESGSSREVSGKLTALSDQFAIIQQDDHKVAVDLSTIDHLQLISHPLRMHVTSDGEQPLESARLGMAYLRSGLLWIPEYTLKLIDEQTAELTLRGTLINEAEDLIDCDVNFVVGVPHFVHANLYSPLAIGQSLRAMGTALPHAGVPQQVMSQMMNRAAIANNAYYNSRTGRGEFTVVEGDEQSPFDSLLQSLPQLDTVGANDFNIYTKPKLTVRRGERAMVTLMTTRLRYQHRYYWQGSGEIEHRLILQNSSTIPWTTGPCLALSDWQPLSEDVLKYTPVGGQGELKVTTAINIAREVRESEVHREFRALQPRQDEHLDRVEVAGTIRLRNFHKQPIDMVITRSVTGRPLQADHEGEILTDAEKLRLVERSGSISWKIQIDPGQETVLNYQYERYVPSN